MPLLVLPSGCSNASKTVDKMLPFWSVTAGEPSENGGSDPKGQRCSPPELLGKRGRWVLISVSTLCNDSTIDSIQFSELIPKYFLNSLPRVYWDSVVIYIRGRMLSRSAQRPCSMLFFLRCVCPMQSTRLTCGLQVAIVYLCQSTEPVKIHVYEIHVYGSYLIHINTKASFLRHVDIYLHYYGIPFFILFNNAWPYRLDEYLPSC